MKAVILAAGTASRLRPLTEHRPKTLLTVGGVPILRRLLANLLAASVDDFIVVTGYLEQQISEAVRTWYPRLRCTFITNPDYATKNPSSLLLARGAIHVSPKGPSLSSR